MGETISEKTEGRVSYHDSGEEMLPRIREDGMSNAFDRYAQQEKIRCKFCLQGLSCQLCTNGPCRISEKSGQDKGVCGIGGDTMAMRNMLLRNIMGAGTYSHHAYEAFRTLRETSQGKTPFKITDANKLKWMCDTVGIDSKQDVNKMAGEIADHLDVDIPQLPIAVTAPEWMEQKATIDGFFAAAYGAYTRLSPIPFVTGAPGLVKLLTEDVEGLTGGKIALGDDPAEAANNIEAHIISKRKGLGLREAD